MKLNLGCGPRHLEGFVNVDLAGNWSGKEPDLSHDIREPLPFPDESAEEIHAYHVLEHMWRWEAEDALKDWQRVLRPGGLLVLEMPCLDKIFGIMQRCVTEGRPLPLRMTLWGLYGDPNYRNEAMCHRWCWSKAEIQAALSDMECMVKAPQTHIPERDMRIEAKKPLRLIAP